MSVTVRCHTKDEKVVTEILEKLEDKFGKETPIAITQGPVHDYLGMIIDYSVKGKANPWGG